MADQASSGSVDDGELQPTRRLVLNWNEVSGALGDLGTFLPHIIGAITVAGMDPTGIFFSFGLFYILSGTFYGIPIAVQPMKAASAAILIQPMDRGSVAGAGLIIGLFFLVAGASGLISRLARALPATVAAGLQLGLGLSLAALSIRLIETQLMVGVATCVLMLAMMRFSRLPVALIAVVLGAVVGVVAHISAPMPHLEFGFYLPRFILPTGPQLANGIERAVLPQIPLTLTNAIIVTAAVARELFPGQVQRVSERNLALSTGLGNLLAAPFGGYLMCHGAGGLTGHFRFGARTGMAPVLVGLLFVLLGLFLGRSGYELLRTIPQAVLGSLLLFSGIDLALSCRPTRFEPPDLFVVLLMAALTVATNPAVAFAIGLPLALALSRGWLKV